MPKAGLVYSEKATLSEILCKPKILPLKSVTLMKLEQMETNLATNLNKWLIIFKFFIISKMSNNNRD